jgi:hypothetical protein
MKVLVSTQLTQGKRKNDFCFVPEDEIVTLGVECDGESIDGECGCRRSLGGVECHKATTTVKVADLPITKAEYEEILFQSFVTGGWGDSNEIKEIAKSDAEMLLSLSEKFNVGDIIERRGETFQRRC